MANLPELLEDMGSAPRCMCGYWTMHILSSPAADGSVGDDYVIHPDDKELLFPRFFNIFARKGRKYQISREKMGKVLKKR